VTAPASQLVPDDIVAERLAAAIAKAREPAPERDEILAALDYVADQEEHSIKAALRNHGKICLAKMRRIVCLRAPVEKARENAE
jgi:hypothetical protein